MINKIFDFCVWLLVQLADLFGLTYKAINVWVFVILWPIATLALMAAVIIQHLKIRGLLKQLKSQASTQ